MSPGPSSPGLNPDELAWNNLKNPGTGRKLIASPEQTRRTIVAHVRQLQKLPILLRGFFRTPTTCYAGAQWQSSCEDYCEMDDRR